VHLQEHQHLAALLALGLGALATRTASRRRPWVFGWRAPANGGGLWLLPLASLGALPAAFWVLGGSGAGFGERAAVWLAATLGVVALEVWFRGLVHGLFAVDHPTQRARGPWLLSRANLVSSLAYAVVATPLAGAALESLTLSPPGWGALEPLAGVATLALAVGLVLGVIRERSQSLVPGIAVQVALVSIVAAAAALLV
jgi:hypothetical protein